MHPCHFSQDPSHPALTPHSCPITTAGMMDPAYFVGRKAILGWLNDTFQMSLTKIEETASGAVACQILDMIYPGMRCLLSYGIRCMDARALERKMCLLQHLTLPTTELTGLALSFCARCAAPKLRGSPCHFDCNTPVPLCISRYTQALCLWPKFVGTHVQRINLYTITRSSSVYLMQKESANLWTCRSWSVPSTKITWSLCNGSSHSLIRIVQQTLKVMML